MLLSSFPCVPLSEQRFYRERQRDPSGHNDTAVLAICRGITWEEHLLSKKWGCDLSPLPQASGEAPSFRTNQHTLPTSCSHTRKPSCWWHPHGPLDPEDPTEEPGRTFPSYLLYRQREPIAQDQQGRSMPALPDCSFLPLYPPAN